MGHCLTRYKFVSVLRNLNCIIRNDRGDDSIPTASDFSLPLVCGVAAGLTVALHGATEGRLPGREECSDAQLETWRRDLPSAVRGLPQQAARRYNSVRPAESLRSLSPAALDSDSEAGGDHHHARERRHARLRQYLVEERYPQRDCLPALQALIACRRFAAITMTSGSFSWRNESTCRNAPSASSSRTQFAKAIPAPFSQKSLKLASASSPFASSRSPIRRPRVSITSTRSGRSSAISAPSCPRAHSFCWFLKRTTRLRICAS